MILKLYISMAKTLKLKVRNFGGLVSTFLEVIGERPVGPKAPLPILNRVKVAYDDVIYRFNSNFFVLQKESVSIS